MSRLRVRLRGKITQEIQLSPERSYLVGRREDCDIVLLKEKGVSREHFKIYFVDDKWNLEVLSLFGDVLAEGEKIQKITLEGQRLIHLGPYEFEYSEVSSDLVPGSNPAKTPDSLGSREFLETDGADKTFIGSATGIPFIKVVSEGGEVREIFKLEGGDTWIAGRDSSCDIMIRDQRVSRRQFEVRRHGNQFQIMDLGSVNGTLINGNPVSSTDLVNIKSGDAISVLNNHLYFELHDPHFQARMDLVNSNTSNPLIAVSQELVPAGPYSQQPVMAGDPQVPVGYGYPAVGSGGEFPPGSVHKKFDFEKHRVKLIAGAVLLLGIAYFFSDQGTTTKAPLIQANGISNPQDAFKKLSPEQQILVKQTYMLAKNLYMQGKYELSKTEVTKIYELVPEYEDTKDIERLANEALAIQDQKRRQEDLEKSKTETEEKIQKVALECKAKVNADFTSAQLEECLSPGLQFNPDHPAFVDLRHQVEELVSRKQIKSTQRAEYQSQVQKLHGLFNIAESNYKKNLYLRAIKEFQIVTASSLPDPNELKPKARRQIAGIQQMLKQKTNEFAQEAETAYKDQKIKEAILSLRKAVDMDPSNEETKDKIARYVLELRKQMMVLYQEGVLEESYGNVEGSENRPGAKDKWKKIMDLDISDGEYYIKAKIKLKKYGVL